MYKPVLTHVITSYVVAEYQFSGGNPGHPSMPTDAKIGAIHGTCTIASSDNHFMPFH
jgi:hypothetical protein